MNSSKNHLVIVQFAGDFRELAKDVKASFQETYHGQVRQVEMLSNIARGSGRPPTDVTLFSCRSPEPYCVELAEGLMAIGAGLDPHRYGKAIWQLVMDEKPTHVAIQFPSRRFVNFSRSSSVKCALVLADSFHGRDPRSRWAARTFGKALQSPHVEWVANHGVNAAAGLLDMGLDARKAIPYELFFEPRGHTIHREPTTGILRFDDEHQFDEATVHPATHSSKHLGGTTGRLTYVGSVSEAKGVGDLVDAIGLLQRQGMLLNVDVIGGGEVEEMRARTRRVGVESLVTFHGKLPNSKAFEMLRSSAVAVVPSRHAYGEGLPLTIYESLSARTPLVVSDHPTFRGNIVDGYSGLVFREKDPAALAKAIRRLLSDDELYFRLSNNSLVAFNNMQIPVRLEDFLTHWVSGFTEDLSWLNQHSMANGKYRVPRDHLQIEGQ